MKFNITLVIALLLTIQCSAMEHQHKKSKTSHNPEEARIRRIVEICAEKHDIPTLEEFIRPLRKMAQDLENQIQFVGFLPETHPLRALPTKTLKNIRKQLNIYEQALNLLRKRKIEHEAWRNKVKGNPIGYLFNRQMTGKDPAAHAYQNTIKGRAHILLNKVKDYVDQLDLKEAHYLLAWTTNAPEEESDALEADIKLIKDCIDECKRHALRILDELEFEQETDDSLTKKLEELLEDKK